MKIQDLQKLAMVAGAMQKEAISSGMYMQALLNRFARAGKELDPDQLQDYIDKSMTPKGYPIMHYLSRTTPINRYASGSFPADEQRGMLGILNKSKIPPKGPLDRRLYSNDEWDLMDQNTFDSAKSLREMATATAQGDTKFQDMLKRILNPLRLPGTRTGYQGQSSIY